MLVSFLTHHLYLDWRDGVYHLANQFLDYEPGIHYPQFQMQAGTTGINLIRMYNPIKQGQDHDADGQFIKKWIPELAKVPKEYIHEPHTMPPLLQLEIGIEIGKDYPLPIINITEAARFAREHVWAHRNNEIVQQENERILITHTRRKKEDKEP
jgi:deoxyribodipyrimidine photo-lyase